MGGSFSRVGGNGATILRRLPTMRARRSRRNDSKKGMLSNDECSISSNAQPCPFDDPNGEVKFVTNSVGIAAIIATNNSGITKVVTNDKSTVNAGIKASHVAPVRAIKEDGDDDDDNDDERMIGPGPASPSFRIFVKGNWDDKDDEIDVGKNDHQALKEAVSTVDINPSKDVETKVNSKKTKRHFRKVLAKRGEATIKNILNLKSCYQDLRRVITRSPHLS